MTNIVQNPFEVILGLDGRGLNGGQVYIGLPNEDPQTDPVAVYWESDLTDPATQPLDVMGGYIVRTNTPTQAYTAGAYSMTVLDRFGNQVFYSPDSSASTSGGFPPTLYAHLDGAAIPADVDYLRSSGDTVVGIGAAWFSTTRFLDAGGDPSPYARTFTASDGRVFEMLPEQDGWSLAAYGMLKNDIGETQQSAINRDSHQMLIDHCIWLERNGHGTQKMMFTPGVYYVDGALRVFSWNEDTGEFAFFSLEISAPARGYVGGIRTQIRNTNIDQPCYVVQGSRNVRFSNFTIQGANPLVSPSYPELVGPPTWCNTAGMRTERHSPACAIVVDPFSLGMTDPDKYPQLTQYYTSNTGGSSATTFENMEMQGFPVGLCLSPSALVQNDDSVMVRDCNLSYNTIAVATCQTQTRSVRIENTRVGSCHIMLDTTSYGNGNGAFPIAKDLNITFVKYLVNSESGVSRGRLINCDVESTFSIGYWGGQGLPLDIEGCQIKFVPPVNLYPPADGGSGEQQANIDYQLIMSGGEVNFFGGYCGFYSNVPVPLSFAGGGAVNFFGTSIDMPVFAEESNSIYYDAVSLRYLSAPRYGARQRFRAETEGALAVNIDAKLPPDATAAFGDSALGTYTRYRNASGVVFIDLTATIAVTVTGTGLATFTAAIPEGFMEDGWVSAAEPFNTLLPDETTVVAIQRVSIGQVRSVDIGTGLVTLQCVPIGMTSGNYTIYAQYLPSFRRRCYGTTTSGSNIITGVPITDHGFAAGDRLLDSEGIPKGSYVTGVDTGAGTITISRNATSSTVSRIMTGVMYLEEAPRTAAPGAETVTFIGDYFENSAGPTADANQMTVAGWKASSVGNPGTLAPLYDSLVSPAT